MTRIAIAACVTALVLCAGSGAAQPAVPTAAPFRVTLLGTGNPRPSLDRFGPAILVEAGSTRVLVDAGRGAAQRLFQIGGADLLRDIDVVLLTHLHSDHVVGLPDAWLTAWVFGRSRPWRVIGPPGTVEMCGHLEQAFAWDVAVRDADEHAGQREGRRGARLEASNVAPGVVLDEMGVKVTAIGVDHGPAAAPAYAFRIEFGGRVLVVSGDTKYYEPLAAAARGADVFVHEVLSPEVELRRTQVPDPAAVERIVARHTTPEQVGRIFAAASPRLGVLSHVVPSPATAGDLLPGLRTRYGGPVAVGYDLMTVEIGERIEVYPRPTKDDK